MLWLGQNNAEMDRLIIRMSEDIKFATKQSGINCTLVVRRNLVQIVMISWKAILHVRRQRKEI